MKLNVWLLLLSVGIGSAAAHSSTTNDYREWSQTVIQTAGYGTAGFANTSFTLTTPHAWTHVSGESTLRVEYHIQYAGDAVAARMNAINFNIDGLEPGGLGKCEIIIQTNAGQTQREHYAGSLSCKTNSYLVDGSHGFKSNVTTSSTSLNQLTIAAWVTIEQRQTISFTQADSHSEITDLSTNLAGARTTINATNTNVSHNHDELHNILLGVPCTANCSTGGNGSSGYDHSLEVNETLDRVIHNHAILHCIADHPANQTACGEDIDTHPLMHEETITELTAVLIPLVVMALMLLWAEKSKEWLVYVVTVLTGIIALVNLWDEMAALRVVVVAAILLVIVRGLTAFESWKAERTEWTE